MEKLLSVGLLTALWCALHSLFVTHWWRDLVRRNFPRYHPFSRLAYVAASTASLGLLMLWIRGLPETVLFDWPGWWAWIRWVGLGEAVVLFWLGARSYDNRYFMGLSQVRDFLWGRPGAAPPFRTGGILGVIRHPWYAGALLFLVFCLPWTDVNLVWRMVFLVYTLVGTELEERKLLKDVGEDYVAYRRRVPRFLPSPRPGSRSRERS